MLDTVSQELRSIIKSKDANDLVIVSAKSFSEAATVRVIYWLKKLLTYFYQERPLLHSDIQVPRRMNALIRRYACLGEDLTKAAYFLFRRQIIFTLQNYAPRKAGRMELTVDNVDEAVLDRNSPLRPYVKKLLSTHSMVKCA
jgi:hypothetical protein